MRTLFRHREGFREECGGVIGFCLWSTGFKTPCVDDLLLQIAVVADFHVLRGEVVGDGVNVWSEREEERPIEAAG